MENGVGLDGGKLTNQLSALNINGYSNSTNNINGINKNDGLFQVMKAVEAAEATIKQQVEENQRLRSELQKRIQELENYKSKDINHGNDHGYLPQTNNRPVSISTGPTDGNNSAFYDSSGHNVNPMIQVSRESPFEAQNLNGPLKLLPSGHTAIDNGGVSQFSSASIFPTRYEPEGEYDPQFNESQHEHELVAISDVKNDRNPLAQAVIDTRDQEQEILLLRKHLADFSIKEAQIHNEKSALEKRIAYMRLAFDQQQQDLVDAASKALSYRQDIIEENIRLTYALQDAEEERSTFISSLMPLLAEYSLQPPVADAQSIVSNVKVLFRHLQEKLIVIEAKLKESQYQLEVWRSGVNSSSFEQSPLYSFGNKNGLELVPQQAYPDAQMPISADPTTTRGWDVPGNSGAVAEGSELDAGMYSPLVSRNNQSLGTTARTAGDQGHVYTTSKNKETVNKQVTFGEPDSHNGVDDLDANWNSKNTPYATTLEDPNSYSPYLAPVLEEPGSSFSEAADDDPLPAVESLQISGDAFPGRELLASGYPVNGTTSCIFEWVRHMEDGSVNYIEGAKNPNYLVSADDVDTYLAIEVQPIDNRKRKGELVKVFANEHRKIVCDTEMHDHIRKALQTGHGEHRLSLWTGYLDIWEAVTLIIKKNGISIKGSGTPVNEKFSASTMVFIPSGNPGEFSIIGLGGVERRLRVEPESSASSSRDVIVLTMRYFIKRSLEKKKAKKKGIFF